MYAGTQKEWIKMKKKKGARALEIERAATQKGRIGEQTARQIKNERWLGGRVRVWR